MNEAKRNESDSNDLLACPFCGNKPEVNRLGSHIDLDCCVCMSRQKSDYMTMEERHTWDQTTFKYSDEAEAKAWAFVVGEWNTRIANTPVDQREMSAPTGGSEEEAQ